MLSLSDSLFDGSLRSFSNGSSNCEPGSGSDSKSCSLFDL